MAQKPPLIWLNCIIFIVTLLLAVGVTPWYAMEYGFQLADWIAFVALVFLSGMSITAGYHRLWSHKTYKASGFIRGLFAIGGALALQNSALHWCSDHRRHHKYVDDNEKDPYSAKRGFWFSHIGWMLREYQPQAGRNYNNVKDLQKDAVVMWQHRHYLSLIVIMNVLVPICLGWLAGNVISMLLLAGAVRLVLVHHCTFFVNSLAHIWGSQPYTNHTTAKDNTLLAVFTFGEGYHNFHHSFETDYRNGINWWHVDPTKWLIKSLSWLGQTWDLRKVPQERIETARLTMQFNQVKGKIHHLPNKDELLDILLEEYQQVKTHLLNYYQANKDLLEAKSKNICYQNLSLQVAQLKLQLSYQLKQWQHLTQRYCKS